MQQRSASKLWCAAVLCLSQLPGGYGLALHQPEAASSAAAPAQPITYFRDVHVTDAIKQVHFNPKASTNSTFATVDIEPVIPSAKDVTFVGLTAETRANGSVFWSDGTSIHRSDTSGANATVVVGPITQLVVYGANFGASQTDIISLKIKGVRCSTIIYHSSSAVGCISGSPALAGQVLSNDDIALVTLMGTSTATSEITLTVWLAEGYAQPVVSSVSVQSLVPSKPYGLTVDTRGHLYWSDFATNKIWRSHTNGTAIQEVVTGVSRVHGLAAGEDGYLYFTEANSGSLKRKLLSTSSTTDAEVLQTGLREPRGVAVGTGMEKGSVFFTEAGGKVSIGWCDGANMQLNPHKPAKTREVLVRTESRARLDGIAVDGVTGVIYWTETNTNRIRYCSTQGTSIRNVVSSADKVVWPRSLTLIPSSSGGGQLLWTHFLGVISSSRTNGANMLTMVDSVASAGAKLIESEVSTYGSKYQFALSK